MTDTATNRRVAAMLDGGPPLWLADGPAPRLPEHVGAVVQTSGTTGAARRVALSRRALTAAAKAARAVADVTWHLALPTQYVAGLMVLVRSIHGGRPVPVAGTDLAQLRPTGQGDAVSLVPTQLHRALADPGVVDRLRAFDLVLLGGAPLAPELRDRAVERGIVVKESYGMSETCGGVMWDGHPLPDVGVRLEGERVTISGPTLFDGYLGQPEATAEVLQRGVFRTSDRGAWEGGRLRILGRFDDVAISGGVNIDVAVVRAAAAQLQPETEVLAVPDEEWGQRVVLVAPGGDLGHWRAALAPALPRAWLPRQLIVAAIPRTDRGKTDWIALESLVARCT
ncbi:MAG: AMP-binding protein [Propionibacteriaceae bacterium]|nr:AMP-binding protein [Propionibacteriaceae bacterium]